MQPATDGDRRTSVQRAGVKGVQYFSAFAIILPKTCWDMLFLGNMNVFRSCCMQSDRH